MKRINNNEVKMVADMQKQIDHYEEFLTNIHFNILSRETILIRKHDDTETYDIWAFVEFTKTHYPEVVKAFNESKGRQGRQGRTQRQQTKTATKPTPFWRRLFGGVPHP